MRAAAASIVFVLISGCTTISRDAGFSDVQKMVAERAGQRVQWNRGTDDDEAAARALENLLKGPLGADQAVQIALLNNRRLQATYEELGIAQAALVQAGLLRNPVFSGSVRSTQGGLPTQVEFSLIQDFLSILFLPLQRQVAAAEFEAVKLRVSGAVIALAAEVRGDYYRVVADEQTIELLRQVVAATGAEYDVAQRMYDAGNITELALATSQTLLQEARLALAQAEANRAVGREQLNALLGLWGAQTQWQSEARLPEIPSQPLDFEDFERRVVAANLELAATRNQLVGTARRYGLTYAALLQPFGLGAAHVREEGIRSTGPAFEFGIPLFDMGQARRAAAIALLRQQEQNYVAQAVEVRAFARATAHTVGTARASALHVRNVILPLRTRIVEQAQLQYNAMQIGVFQLLQAKRDQITAGQQYIENLRDYWIASAGFAQALSGRIDLSRSRFRAELRNERGIAGSAEVGATPGSGAAGN